MVVGWGLGGPFGVEKLWDSGIKWIRRKIHYYLLEGVSTNIIPLTDKVLLLLMDGPKLNLTHNVCTKLPIWSRVPLNSQQLSTPPRNQGMTLRNWFLSGLVCKFPDLNKACSDTLIETLYAVRYRFNLLKRLPSISQTYIQLSIAEHNSTSSVNFALTMQAWTQFNTTFISKLPEPGWCFPVLCIPPDTWAISCTKHGPKYIYCIWEIIKQNVRTFIEILNKNNYITRK